MAAAQTILVGYQTDRNILFHNLDLKCDTNTQKTTHKRHCISPILTSASVPQQVAVNVLDSGVDGGPTGHTTRGHIRVCLRIDILETFPGHTGAEL